MSSNTPYRINPSNVYNIDYTKPGRVLIINNKYFDAEKLTRDGSDSDVIRLNRIFDTLKFQVECVLEKNAAEIRRKINEYAKYDYTNEGCLIVFVMSHGSKGLIKNLSEDIYTTEFIKPFKDRTLKGCQTLKGKPKLFFFQACRGNSKMETLDVEGREEDEQTTEMDADDEINSNGPRVCTEADYLYSFSTIDGYSSMRDTCQGAWFIQALCDVLEKGYVQEISQILVFVNNIVSQKETETTRKKVMPTFENRLTKLFYIRQPCNEPSVCIFIK